MPNVYTHSPLRLLSRSRGVHSGQFACDVMLGHVFRVEGKSLKSISLPLGKWLLRSVVDGFTMLEIQGVALCVSAVSEAVTE